MSNNNRIKFEAPTDSVIEITINSLADPRSASFPFPYYRATKQVCIWDGTRYIIAISCDGQTREEAIKKVDKRISELKAKAD